MIIDINKTINLLANERKIFHSEADFQFSFAWKIKEVYPKANIRLEYINNDIKNMHIDVLIELILVSEKVGRYYNMNGKTN